MIFLGKYLLCKGWTYGEDEDELKFGMFDATKNSWAKVRCNMTNHRGDFSMKIFSYNDECFFQVFNLANEKVTTYRVRCDFDSKVPTITIAKRMSTKSVLSMGNPEVETLMRKQILTFDKHKLGMSKDPLKCTCHRSSEPHTGPYLVRIFDWSEGIAEELKL